MHDIVDLGQGAMLVGLPDSYDFSALDALLATLEQAGTEQEIILETTLDRREVTDEAAQP